MLEFQNALVSISCSSYSLFIVLAVILSILVSILLLFRFAFEPRKSIPGILIAAILVFIGARLLYIVTHIHYYSIAFKRIWEMKLSGFSMIGGLVLATIGCAIYASIMKIDFWRLADLLAPGLGVGIALSKMGCYLNGCCFGTRTNLPWAVHFPYDSPAHKYYLQYIKEKGTFSLTSMLVSPAIHPTQLYEVIGAMAAVLVAIVVLEKKVETGLAALIAAFVFVMTRLVTFYFRAPIAMDENPNGMYPAIYMILLVLLVHIARKRLYHKITPS